MKLLCVLIISFTFIACSSSSKKSVKESGEKISESANKAIEKVEESTPAVEEISKAQSCNVRANRSTINFGSPKVTSRAFRRLRLKASDPFTITNVSSFPRPFGYYNSGDFPGEATYHDYSLCDMSAASTDCSINLEFRPRAVESYESKITIAYNDSQGESCSIDVPLKGVSTESYLGKDSSKGLPDN